MATKTTTSTSADISVSSVFLRWGSQSAHLGAPNATRRDGNSISSVESMRSTSSATNAIPHVEFDDNLVSFRHIASLVNVAFQLQDVVSYEEFITYHMKKKSPMLYALVTTIATVGLLPMTVYMVIRDVYRAYEGDSQSVGYVLSSILGLCAVLAMIGLGVVILWNPIYLQDLIHIRYRNAVMRWVYWMPESAAKSFPSSGSAREEGNPSLEVSEFSADSVLFQRLYFLKHGFFASIYLFSYFVFFRRLCLPACRDATVFGAQHERVVRHVQDMFALNDCHHNPSSSAMLLQAETFAMLTVPLFICLSYTAIDTRLIWFGLCGSCICYIIACVDLEDTKSIPLVAVWILFCVCMLVDITAKRIMDYLLSKLLFGRVLSTGQETERIHASEMRHMIANMAHDLKTPLSSFTTGLDFIQCVIDDSNRGLNMISTEDALMSIQTCLTNIRNTNSFMLMTINRFIDYTKASKGLKLVPRPETIDLMETLQLPLQCMQNIQNRIQITLNKIPRDICSCIITDKQWLQENILCLLSNAVKYSTAGTVSITVVLESSPKVRPTANNKASKPHTTQTTVNLPASRGPDNNSPTVSLTTPSKLNRILPVSFSFYNPSSVPKKSKRRQSDPPEMSSRTLEISRYSHNMGSMTKPPAGSTAGPNSMAMSANEKTAQQRARLLAEKLAEVNNQDESSNTEEDRNYDYFLRFEIEDTGIGMTEEAMSSLFSPFKQTQRLAGGTGLGLYSLAKRIEAMQGKYGVLRRRDGQQGSLFWFAIPYKADRVFAALSAQEDVASSVKSSYVSLAAKLSISMPMRANSNTPRGMNPNRASSFGLNRHQLALETAIQSVVLGDNNTTVGAESPRSGRGNPPNTFVSRIADKEQHQQQPFRQGTVSSTVPLSPTHSKTQSSAIAKLDILIVDDAPSILKMTGMVLKRLGHSITTAENGDVAVKLVKSRWEESRGKFDVILMDLQMPVMDGLEATRRIRGLGMEVHQVIIAMSANSDHGTMQEAYTAGVDTFMGKPFNVATFNDTVDHLLKEAVAAVSSAAGGGDIMKDGEHIALPVVAIPSSSDNGGTTTVVRSGVNWQTHHLESEPRHHK